MLNSLLEIFGSKIKAQEILLLLKDAKPVVRQGFYKPELPAVEQFCTKNSLFLVKSKFKVLIDDKETSFSNRGLRISESDPRLGMYFVYISKDEKSALIASYAELMLRHRELGELLGYPGCCVDFFCNNFCESKTDLQHIPSNPWTNLSKRDEDCVLLSHFPCASDCRQSIKLAKEYHKIISEADARQGKELLCKLTL